MALIYHATLEDLLPTVGDSELVAGNGAAVNEDHLSLPNNSDYAAGVYPVTPIALGSTYTISVWFKDLKARSSSQENYMMLSGSSFGNGSNGSHDGNQAAYDIVLWHDDELGSWHSTGGWQSSGYVMTQDDFTGNGWHHLVASFDNGTLTYYIDGAQVGNSVSYTGSASIEIFGGWLNYNYSSIADYIDDIRVYDTPMTAGDVSALYSAGRDSVNEPHDDTTPVSRYSFVEDASDSVGSSDGTVTGASFVDGHIVFDGSGDFVELPHSDNHGFSGDNVSVSTWVKTTSTENDVIWLKAYGDNGGDSLFELAVNHSGDENKARLFWRNSDGQAVGSGTCISTSDINDGEWHHILAVKSGSDLHLYVDGVLESSASGLSGDFTGKLFYLGKWDHPSYSPQKFYTGSMDDFRIWDSPLPADAASALHAAGRDPEESMEPYDPSSGEIDARGKLVDLAGLDPITTLLVDEATRFMTSTDAQIEDGPTNEVEIHRAEFDINLVDFNRLGEPWAQGDDTVDGEGYKIIPAEGIKYKVEEDLAGAIQGGDDSVSVEEMLAGDNSDVRMVAFLEIPAPDQPFQAKIVKFHLDVEQTSASGSSLPVITINDHPPTELEQSEDSEYTDSGAVAMDGDLDISHLVRVSGDIVNLSEIGQYNITYTVEDADGNEASATRLVEIIAASESTDEDTSEEGDDDSDNGENETQPMEEINMSEFNFTGDKQSTLTKTINGDSLPVGEEEKLDSAVSTSVAQGSATPSPADTCRATQIMGLLKSKGLDLCGDLQMKNGAEIYTSDGTAVSSFVKAMDIVYGYFNDDSVFVHLDPASEMKLDESIVAADLGTLAAGATEGGVQTGLDGQSQSILDDTGATAGSATPASWAGSSARTGRWYLRLVRMNNAIEFKALAAIDSLFDGVGAAPKVASILGALKEVEELQDIVKAALDAERLVRAEQFNALEDSVEQSFKNLIHFMQDLETAMRDFVIAGDEEVMTHIDARLNTLGNSVKDLHNKTRFHGIADLSALGDGSCEDGVVVFNSGDFTALIASEITEWMIDVEVQQGTGDSAKRRGDLHIEYTAEITTDGALKIISAVDGCSNLPAQAKLVVNAIYCGDVTDGDVPKGSDGTVANAYVAPNTLSERTEGNSMYNDISTDAGHQAGYIVGLTQNDA